LGDSQRFVEKVSKSDLVLCAVQVHLVTQPDLYLRGEGVPYTVVLAAFGAPDESSVIGCTIDELLVRAQPMRAWHGLVSHYAE